ncbi:cytochrome P450 [Mycena crocata]|nr:cytochrome P450 [Mycena crocata]
MHYGSVVAGVVVPWVVYLMLRRRESAVRHIAGPPSPSWIFGHMLQLLLPARYGEHEFRWLKSYGAVYRLKGCLGQERLMVSDPLALQYILNGPQFIHAPVVETSIDLLYGSESVIALHGEPHRRLRAAMNVGFSAAAVREYQPMFEKVAQALSEQLDDSSLEPRDICPLLSDATLSAVSEAVLGCSMQDLGEDLVETNTKIFILASSLSASQILGDALGSRLPTWILDAAVRLPTASFKTLRRERELANRLGRKIAREKLEAAKQGLEPDHDVYSLLLNPDPADQAREPLSEEVVAAQTAIILIAGQDTTANTLAFGLVELAKDLKFQEKLRAEIHGAVGLGRDNVAYDSMPLLNAFIKETLRLYPAGPLLDRVTTQDALIPLAESITTSTGEHISQIFIRKGQLVTAAIASYQRLESRWGVDAHEFRLSRWIDGTISKGEAVGPYANLLSFLGGPGVCLGWRFAILEMQVIICELVGKFSFALPENVSVSARHATSLFPIVSTGQKGAPLRVARIL